MNEGSSTKNSKDGQSVVVVLCHSYNKFQKAILHSKLDSKKRFVQEYSPTHLRPKGSRIAGQRQSHGRWDGCLPKLKAIKIACLMLNAIDWRLLIFYPTSTQVRRLGGREQKLDLRLGPLQLGLCLVSTSMKIMQILCGHSFAWSDTNSTKYHHAV